jgi:hypothetical protein
MFGPFRKAPKVLLDGHVRGILAYGDVPHFCTDHFYESPSFGTVCGPKSISVAPELRSADEH